MTLYGRFIALWSPIFHHSVAQSSFAVLRHSYDLNSLEFISFSLGENPRFLSQCHAFDFFSGRILLISRKALRYEIWNCACVGQQSRSFASSELTMMIWQKRAIKIISTGSGFSKLSKRKDPCFSLIWTQPISFQIFLLGPGKRFDVVGDPDKADGSLLFC